MRLCLRWKNKQSTLHSHPIFIIDILLVLLIALTLTAWQAAYSL